LKSKLRDDVIRYSSAIVVCLSLAVLYLLFIYRLYFVADWSSLSKIEEWIFITLVLRLIALLLVSRRYKIQPLAPILLFSIESLLIPPLLILYVVSGNPGYAVAMGTILTAWIGASAVVLSPYLIYSFSKSMLDYASLVGVIALSGLEFAYYLFLAIIVEEATPPILGFTGLGAYLVGSLKGQITSVGTPLPLVSDTVVAGASVVFFVAMLVYSTMGSHDLGTNISLSAVLLVPLGALIALFAWMSLFGSFASTVFSNVSSNLFIVLTLPTFALGIIIWGTTRGKD
jgi:hypothetical protein